MQTTYDYPEFDYLQSAEQRTGTVRRHPVVVVGAGPVGLTAGNLGPVGVRHSDAG